LRLSGSEFPYGAKTKVFAPALLEDYKTAALPRRSILSAAERDSLLAMPNTQDELIRHYTLSEYVGLFLVKVRETLTAGCH
jgi:hypothetical protein